MPLDCSITLRSSSNNTLEWLIISEENPSIASSEVSISVSPNDLTFYSIPSSGVYDSLDLHLYLSETELTELNPAFANTKPIYTLIQINLRDNDGQYTTYTLDHSSYLFSTPAISPDGGDLTATGDILSSAPQIHSITVLPNSNIRILFSDKNGYNDTITISGYISNLNSTYETLEFYHPLYGSYGLEQTTPINVTHAYFEDYCGKYITFTYPNTYLFVYTIDSNGHTGDNIRMYYTPEDPTPEPMFPIDLIAFPPTESGGNTNDNLTIHNNNGPAVYVSSLSFNDFIFKDGLDHVQTLSAINLKFSLPDEALQPGSSITIPLSLYIPFGTKPGKIETSGTIKLST